MDLLLAAAREQGAQAIYPGYGFLSESAEFAEACEAAGIAFVGPTPMQIREFGLKHRSRELAALAGVPMTPGTGLLSSLGEALAQAERIGYPVMLKSTAGGGGIGLSRCDNEAELTAAYDSVQRMGEHFFRDGGAFIERYVDNARHVEVQIFGDGQGRVLALGERDCSVQRRNQKVIEETPAPNLPPATRAALLEAAVRLGESVGYRSAGTVEFIYDPARDSFYFLEVNTRLQVEHPVTEAVTGLDLVECMLRVAAGEPLDLQAMSRAAWRVHRGAAVRRGSAAPVPAFAGRADRGLFSRGPARGWLGGDRHRGAGLLRSHAGQADRAWRHARNGAGPAVRRAGAHAPARHRHQPGLPAPDRGRRALRGGELSTRFLETFEYRPAAIEVLEAGTYTSVQDYPGRAGYWDIGVPPSGPMDDYAFRLANRIVGNAPDAAGIEATLAGPTLRFHGDAVIALTGAQCAATLDGAPVPMWRPVAVRAGQVLATGRALSGCRMYLAVRDGLDVPVYLGSRSTFALGQFGGHAGRTLRVGDMLPRVRPELPGAPAAPEAEPQAAPPELVPAYGDTWRIGVLYGPHGAPDFFAGGHRRLLRRRLGSPLQLQSPGRAPDRPQAGLGARERRRGRAASVQHPRLRIRHRQHQLHRRQPRDPDPRRPQPGRLRLPGHDRQGRAVEGGAGQAG